MQSTRRLAAGTALAFVALAGSFALAQPFAGAHDGPHPAPAAPAVSAELTGAQRQVIREATRRFADVDVALAEGYAPAGPCAELPGVGGMGQHWVNGALLGDDDFVDPTKPEVLLYGERADGRLELLGVEYMTVDDDQDLSTDGDRPTLMGHAFDGPMPGHDGEMPVHYDLHAWVFEANPAGSLATWNPRVSC